MNILKIKNKAQLKEHLKEIASRLDRVDYRLINLLGKGENGFIYSTTYEGRPAAIKITVDYDEAKTSAALVGKKLKHVVQFYKVFQLKSVEGVYFIVQEKLNPLREDVKELLVRFLNYTAMNTEIAQTAYQADMQYNFKTLDGVENYIYDAISDLAMAAETVSNVARILHAVGRVNSVMRGYIVIASNPDNYFQLYDVLDIIETQPKLIQQLLSGLLELVKQGIAFHDTHANNVMQATDGTLKWVDLGFGSFAKKAGRIEELNASSNNSRWIKR